MSLPMLFRDEMKGFYKSKVMVFLWFGLPLMSLLLHLWYPDTGSEISFTTVSALLVSSLGGTLASVMLAVSIINEKNRRVYDLFLIRPIKRRDLLFAKFLAIYTCIAIASILALMLGMGIDYAMHGGTPAQMLKGAGESMTISLSMMAISSSVGIVIGVASPSVLVGAILVVYGGNQISIIPTIPTLLKISNPIPFTVALGIVITMIFLALSVVIFNKKQF